MNNVNQLKRGLFLIFGFLFFLPISFAQKNIEQKVQRDPVLEADSMHNLEVARLMFRLRKAYKGVLMRCEEIIAANPDFSKMDEVLYLSGMSSYYLLEGKGSQKVNLNDEKEKEKYNPEKLLADAIVYLKMLVEKYPQSRFRQEAEKTLKLLEEKENSSKNKKTD
jgi:outer membrane protein assembly factor BamD (BamD/ComL family)